MFGPDRLAGLVLVDSSVGELPVPASGTDFRQRLGEHRVETLNEFCHARRGQSGIAALVRSARRMTLDDSLALLSYPFDRCHWRRIAHAYDRPLLYVVTPQYDPGHGHHPDRAMHVQPEGSLATT